MSYKKFSIAIVSIIAAIFIGNILLWQGVTKPVFFESEAGHGDLRRLASYNIPEPSTQPRDYQGRHVEFSDYIKYLRDNKVEPTSAASIRSFHETSAQSFSKYGKPENVYGHFDIITIGDSFTNGGGAGYYQDYMAEKYGLSILNIPMSFLPNGNALSLLYVLLRDGYIAAWQPKAIIIGAAEHYANGRYGEELVSVPAEKLAIKSDDAPASGYLNDVYKAQEQLAPTLMVRSNVELIKNKLTYLLSGDDLELSPTVARQPLTQKFFSQKSEADILYFSREDLKFLTEPPNTGLINDNFNMADAELKKAVPGCVLIFMPAVDKLDLYAPYLKYPERIFTKAGNENSSLPENPFFPQLAAAHKQYIFIDTRSILRRLLATGELDVYWNDDTHYSYRAQESIADAVLSVMKD